MGAMVWQSAFKLTNKSKERFSVFKDRWFLFGFALRIFLLFFSGGEFFRNLFIPFVDHSILNPLENPWGSFSPDHFPYGYFPFLLLAVPKFILYQFFGQAALGLNPLSFAAMKLPLLVFDTATLWIFTRWSTSGFKRVVLFYWLNPILIYITYVYCQLDIISISLLIMALFMMTKNRLSWSAGFFGLAVSSKFHVLIVFPFLMAYIWQNYFRKKATQEILAFSTVFFGVAAAFFAPVYFAGQFQFAAGGSPEFQRILSLKIDFSDGLQMYVGLALVSVVLGRLVFSTRISTAGLVFGCGMILGTLLLATNPRPGWYFWVVPFLSFFFSQYVNSASLLMFFSWLVYLVHFAILDALQLSLAKSVGLTILQSSFLGQLVVLFAVCVNREASIKHRVRPFFLGISGDSGAGKNYFTRIVQDLLNDQSILVVEGDNYHKWERGNKNWEELTHLNPMANQLFDLSHHAKMFSQGRAITYRNYDHDTGQFTMPQMISPKKTIVIQGLHTLYLKGLRENLDLRIFLNPNENVRLFWKTQRDVNQRGHSLEKVKTSIQNRAKDAKVHVAPQIEKSDWTIEYLSSEPVDPFNLSAQLTQLELKYYLNTDEPIFDLLDLLKASGLHFELEFLEGQDKVSVHFKNQLTKSTLERVAIQLFPHLKPLTRSAIEPHFHEGFEGLHQLFLLALLQKRLLLDSI